MKRFKREQSVSTTYFKPVVGEAIICRAIALSTPKKEGLKAKNPDLDSAVFTTVFGDDLEERGRYLATHHGIVHPFKSGKIKQGDYFEVLLEDVMPNEENPERPGFYKYAITPLTLEDSETEETETGETETGETETGETETEEAEKPAKKK